MGELRLMGADQGVLFRLLLAEAGVLGTIGAFIGVGYGILLAHFLVGMVSESMGVIFQLSFPVQDLSLGFRQQAPIAFLGIGTALFASSFAAFRAADQTVGSPSQGSRNTTPRSRSAILVVAWLGMLAVAALGLFLQRELKSFLWGNFGSTMWNSSVLVIAIPIVGWSVALWARLLPRIFGPEGRFAADSLARSRVRSGVTVAAVALVLAVAVTVTTLALSFRRSVASYSEAGGFLLGDLVASSMTTAGGWLESPLPAEVGDRIREVPGVQDVQAWRVIFGQMYRGERIALFALDDGFLDAARFGARWYREGDARLAAAAIRDGRCQHLDGLGRPVRSRDRRLHRSRHPDRVREPADRRHRARLPLGSRKRDVEPTPAEGALARGGRIAIPRVSEPRSKCIRGPGEHRPRSANPAPHQGSAAARRRRV
jgi:putative ABC transport system permease protein